MPSSFNYFNKTTVGNVAHIEINRPEKSNALNADAWTELGLLFSEIGQADDIRSVVLSGKGKHFCAGMDLSTLMSLPGKWNMDCEATKREQIRRFIRKIQECISQIEQAPVPVIAAIHGACIGGALSIITACDFSYCSADSYFSIKETDLGIVPDIGVLQRMPLNVNAAHIAELSYTARQFTAAEGLKIGLINRVSEDREKLMEEAQKTAEEIAGKSPLVIRGIKTMMRYRRSHTVEESLDYVATWNAAFLLSEDLGKAMNAYVSGSKPEF